MDTPRNRFTVTNILVALCTAFLSMMPTAVVKVNARGMGHEHEQPWRRSSLLEAPIAAARSIIGRLKARFDRVQRHALFGPGAIATAALIAYLVNPAALLAAPAVFGALTEGQHAGEFLMEERGGPGYPSRENITVLSGQNLEAGEVVGRVTKGIGRVSVPTVVATASANGTVSAVFAGPEVEVGDYVLTCTAAVAHGGVWSLTTPSGKALPTLTMTPGAGGSTTYTSRHINFTITDGSTDFAAGDVFTFVVSTTAPTILGGTGTNTISALSLGPDAKTGRYQVICVEAITNGGRWQVFSPDGDSIGHYLQTAGSTTATAFTNRQINFTITDATDVIVGNSFEVCVFNQLAGGKVVEWDPTTFDGRHQASGVLFDNIDATSADTTGVIVARDATVMKGALKWASAITAAQKESAYRDLAARGVIAR